MGNELRYPMILGRGTGILLRGVTYQCIYLLLGLKVVPVEGEA